MEHGWCPTNYPGRTPIQIVGHLLFSVIILAAGQTRTSNQILRKAVRVRTAHDVGHSSSASVSAETTFYWACHFRFSLARKFPFLEIEKPMRRPRRPRMRCCRARLAEFRQQDAEWFPARALRDKTENQQAVPMG